MPKLRNKDGLTNFVCDKIREEILEKRFLPGAPLSEIPLGKKLGTSRTPVREALRMLSKEGLVRLIPGRGAFVTEISVEDIKEIYEIRRALETIAFQSAAKRIPDETLDEIASFWRDLRVKVESGARFDKKIIADGDRALHMRIIGYASNQRIREILLSLQSQIGRMQLLALFSLKDTLNTISQHEEIIACMRNRDEEQIRKVLYNHIVLSEGYILSNFMNA
ncbi:GntR family transcriptional regulator [Aminivibrio sp.]|uniref:GntR family transcriptional regulator n=1 Tax=Aminivibrio sp. TaxID=1872489 RepID=UPI0025C2F1C2|nr:GntR family transcriptional regulator [Aminivibrio sp.]